MMYNKVQILWGPGAEDKLTFDLDDISPTSSYIVQSISGLEPPSIDLAIADKVVEGGFYQGRRPQNREIVMLVSFQPNYSVGEDAGVLRKRLYRMLSPKLSGNVRFRLLDDSETQWVETVGQIKRMEPNIFTKDPQIQISMSCFSAYFEEPLYTHPSPATLNGLNPLPVTNNADVSVGFSLNLTLTAASASFTLTGNLAGQHLKITHAFLANDQILINTNPGSRSLKRVRSGVADLNLLPSLSLDSTWLLFEPGLNNLKPSLTTYTVQSLSFTPKHWGF